MHWPFLALSVFFTAAAVAHSGLSLHQSAGPKRQSMTNPNGNLPWGLFYFSSLLSYPALIAATCSFGPTTYVPVPVLLKMCIYIIIIGLLLLLFFPSQLPFPLVLLLFSPNVWT